ncbi:NAD-dependent epimerase/dehydratase family protein [Conexivisphaera calida]|uniref:UDP-glucose 4-epimerase n=1 Tax=Conexivisphaera calida TaxID=1874277 RepID=A0A4P2VCI6_9ARCH|nr:NAD-dependent epimerase/dehydratase family protein [Conexivisphaera calida]BBE41831.1 UDP-glucose 4-epimerase [Conexivisphaera calida]
MVHVIAGGSGYLGEHLSRRLISKGEEVLVVDRYPPRSGAGYVEHDLREPLKLDVEGPAIYHLAANPSVKATMEEVRTRFDEELRTTLNVAELARITDAELMVYVSSPTVYGNAQTPTPESAPLRPISYHGLYKALSESVIDFYARNYGIRSLTVRMTNVAGGSMTHGVIVDFVRRLRANPGELEIYGDGGQGRSYLYVDDAMSALEVLENSRASGVYNAGNDDWISVNEIAMIVSSVMGLEPRIKYNRCTLEAKEALGGGWPGDIRLVFPDSSKLKSLGWAPTMNSRDAVVRAVKDLVGSS